MLFFVTGASGSGKTSVIPLLKDILPDISIFDFDEMGVPKNADKIWRQKNTDYWVKKAYEYQLQEKDICVCGQAVLGKILCCPSASLLKEIFVCHLECQDAVRINRLRKRNTYGVNQEMLNWSAWLRMHIIDPTWHQDVITKDSWKEMRWDNLNKYSKTIDLWKAYSIDTTNLSKKEIAKKIAEWITEKIKTPN